MYEVFEKGHDLYSTIASMVYNLPYNSCKEFKDTLSPINQTQLEIEVGEKLVLYADDLVTLSSGETQLAKLLKIGDNLKTDGADVTISAINTEDDITYKILISK